LEQNLAEYGDVYRTVSDRSITARIPTVLVEVPAEADEMLSAAS